VNTTLPVRPRRVLLVAIAALVIGALALALAPSSHHGHHTTVSAALRDGILAQFPARFDR
jgi:hypothetical protein